MVAVLGATVCAYLGVTLLRGLSPSTTFDWDSLDGAVQNMAARQDVYREYLNCCTDPFQAFHGYIYPPILVQLLQPLAGLSRVDSGRVWIFLMYMFLVAAVVVTERTIRPMTSVTTRLVLLGAAGLFLPLLRTLQLLQIGTLMLVLQAVAAYGFVRLGDSASGGAAVALATGIRLTPAPLALLYVRPRAVARRSLLGFGATAVVLVAVMFALVGETPEFVLRVIPRLAQGTAFIHNVSLLGVARRTELLATGVSHPGTRLAVSAVSVLLVLATWRLSWDARDDPSRAAAFGTLLVVTTLSSPITWQHHLSVDLLAIALLAAAAGGERKTLWLLAAAYLLLSPNQIVQAAGYYVTGGHLGGWGLVPYTLVTSVNLAGGLLLWLVGMVTLWRLSRPGRVSRRRIAIVATAAAG